MVAEPRIHSATEKIVRNWLQTVHNRPVRYGYDEKAALPFFIVKHVTGLDDDALIQIDVWGVDKESTMDQLNLLLNLIDGVSNYNTPYGVIAGATPVTYTWQPDGTQPRYICDARFVTFTTA